MITKIIVAIIALQHIWILTLEMFFWTKPQGRKVFGTTAEFAKATRVLAANQGLYNGFLAAGLFWALLMPHPAFQYYLEVFFPSCVLVAGVFGGLTANKKILIGQAGPALVGLVARLLSL